MFLATCMGKFFSRRLLYIKQHLLIMLWGHFTKDCFFPIGPIWTRLSSMNHYFDRPDCRPESPRKSDRLLFFNKSSGGRLGRPMICWGSGAYTPSTIRTTLGRERQRLSKAPEGGRDNGDLQGCIMLSCLCNAVSRDAWGQAQYGITQATRHDTTHRINILY